MEQLPYSHSADAETFIFPSSVQIEQLSGSVGSVGSVLCRCEDQGGVMSLHSGYGEALRGLLVSEGKASSPWLVGLAGLAGLAAGFFLQTWFT